MKLRIGFVSNSSSSSFCVYGASVDDFSLNIEVLDRLEKSFSENKELIKEIAKCKEALKADEDCDMSDYLYDIMEALQVSYMFSDITLLIGRSYNTLKDEETGKQFRDSTTEKLRLILGDPKLECNYINEVNYNY